MEIKMEIKVKAAAKVNLMLDILGKLPNGYHKLWMIMQSVGVYDTVTVKKAEPGKISIASNLEAVPSGDKNIAYRAAEKFFAFCKIEGGADIYIEKHIPMAAGLAGGSADAAAVLTALDALYETKLPMKKLCKIGLSLGADVPFCLQGGTMLAQDIGGVLSQLPDLSECYFVLAKPDISVSTAEAYSLADSANLRHLDTDGMLRSILDEKLDDTAALLGNVFEQVVDVPQRVAIKEIMRRHDAKGCCMSGSGPTVFAMFEEKEAAEKCAAELSEKYSEVYVCPTAEYGCEIID